jgi:mannose-6-phosphate isomerase-like protein (cupin superfamily)
VGDSLKKYMKGFHIDIEKETLANTHFRKVLYTSKHSQVVLMSLPAGQDIGMEIHADNDQFFRIEAGEGLCVIDGNEYSLSDGSAIVVPAGSEHNVTNTSDSEDLRLYTIYAPAHHKDGIIRATKEEAEANEADFDGETSE